MLCKIKDAFSDSREAAIAGLGVFLFGFYVLYARRQMFKEDLHSHHKNKIKYSLKTLLQQQKNKRFHKIAITESPLNRSKFTSEVLSLVKIQLTAHKVTTLVNCSPIKLLNAGCQCFLETLSYVDDEDERQIENYYENAVRCQLLVEKTIVDIECIKKSNETVIMLCDNNTLDLKVRAVHSTWNKFLKKNRIDEEDLKRNYSRVIHLESIDEKNPQANRQDAHIREIWQQYPEYYPLKYNHKQNYQQNKARACKFILQLLNPIIDSKQ